MKDQNKQAILNQDIDAKLDLVLELVADVPDIKQRLIIVEEKVDDLTLDMQVVKEVLFEHSKKLHEQDLKFAKLGV